jgi:hypothetical protein
VDDIILTGSSLAVLRSLISRFYSQFSMKDLGDIHYFLGIEACRTPQHLLLTQSKSLLSKLSRHYMNNCKPASTLVASGKKLSLYDGTLLPDPSQYRSIVGALQYLTFTRPDITYAVQQVCQFMHVPRDVHFQAVKRILRYLKRTIGYGVRFLPCSYPSLVCYVDADWAASLVPLQLGKKPFPFSRSLSFLSFCRASLLSLTRCSPLNLGLGSLSFFHLGKTL